MNQPDQPTPPDNQTQSKTQESSHYQHNQNYYQYLYPSYYNDYNQIIYDPSSYSQQYIYPQQYIDYSSYYQYQNTITLDHKSTLPPQIKVPKLSRNQKRKQKLKEKKEQLESQRKQIGDWVKYESKPLINEILKLEQQEKHRIEKKKMKLSHLVQIGKQVYKLRKKMGLLRAQTAKAKIAKTLGLVHKKKPSMIKRMNERYDALLKKGKPIKIIQEESEWENQIQVKTQKASLQQTNGQVQAQQIVKMNQVVKYPSPGKLSGSIFNNIQIRQWVNHMPSESLQAKILQLVNKLAYQQAIKKIKQPLKWKKRVVSGFNQCMRTVKIKQQSKKCKCLFVALNISRNPLKLATDDRVIQIIKSANEHNIPVIHVSTRSKLGRAFLGKFGPRLSVVSIINYEGSQQLFSLIIEEWKSLQNQYNQL